MKVPTLTVLAFRIFFSEIRGLIQIDDIDTFTIMHETTKKGVAVVGR